MSSQRTIFINSKKPNALMFLYSCYTVIKHSIILKGFNPAEVMLLRFALMRLKNKKKVKIIIYRYVQHKRESEYS